MDWAIWETVHQCPPHFCLSPEWVNASVCLCVWEWEWVRECLCGCVSECMCLWVRETDKKYLCVEQRKCEIPRMIRELYTRTSGRSLTASCDPGEGEGAGGWLRVCWALGFGFKQSGSCTCNCLATTCLYKSPKGNHNNLLSAQIVLGPVVPP